MVAEDFDETFRTVQELPANRYDVRSIVNKGRSECLSLAQKHSGSLILVLASQSNGDQRALFVFLNEAC
jgi:hypothetical protein